MKRIYKIKEDVQMTFSITCKTLHDDAERHYQIESDKLEVAVQNLLEVIAKKVTTSGIEILEVNVNE
ncbi:MAG: hypothetical protein PHY47_12855 [Lachnospiraceae bacterium]|nr:hypothetical protein [Lachnospiraceae bacterium]